MDSAELAPLYLIFASDRGTADLSATTPGFSGLVIEDEANLRLNFIDGITHSFVVNLFPGYLDIVGQPPTPYDPVPFPFPIKTSVSLFGK